MQDELGNLLLEYPVRLKATAGVSKRLHAVARVTHADLADPIWYACRRCHLVWDDSPLRRPEDVTCSNCYSDNVLVVAVRLMFRNWGRHNGGKQEQRQRYMFAKQRKVKATRDK